MYLKKNQAVSSQTTVTDTLHRVLGVVRIDAMLFRFVTQRKATGEKKNEEKVEKV